jgi:uncharacterized protein YndB with AHSA1/START domain
MTNMSVERSVWIEAPAAQVWGAVSEPEQMAKWFLPPMLPAQLQRAADGTLSLHMGPMASDLAIMERLEEGRRLRLTSLPERQLDITCTLTPERGGTTVAIHMAGFDRLPAPGGQERLAPSGAAWEKALQNLKAYVDGGELPFPEGYVSALFGYRREKLHKLSVERSLWLNAPRERVWQALTDPALIEQWFSPGTTWRVTKQGVGGRLSVVNRETGADEYGQVIEVLEPPHRLVTRAEPPEKPYASRWTLEEENGGTRLTLAHEGYELEAEDLRHNNLEQNTFGFGMMLANLGAVVEGRAVPYPGGF